MSTNFERGAKVEVDARHSLYDRLTGVVVDVDAKGIHEVLLDRPGPVGEGTTIFNRSELVARGHGRPLSRGERLTRWLNRVLA